LEKLKKINAQTNKVELFFGYYQPSKELTAILEEKSGKTTNEITNKIICPELLFKKPILF
jgi:hypothetical protein